ncbi:MAG: type II toxin-antitoxin system HicB family antitoxin [Planctomycetes bacterium]|nr:type II toxin-antitoxin system HicB family antitoxin [Planctomycetota bacterium]
MPVRSKESCVPKNVATRTVIDRPFKPDILKRARQIARQYRLILEPEAEVGFIGRSIELPSVFADGESADDCVAATREALEVAVATMLESGVSPPAPSARGLRQAQVNIRMTAEEKLILEDAARRGGFRGVSDYIRSSVLRRSTSTLTSVRKPRVAKPR